MPFTPAHIVAVLPLRKRAFFSMTGLIIGSMVPDYEYFIRMTLYGHYGHTLPGIVLFDLPVALLLYIVYHAVVRRQLVRHLPPALYSRFGCAENFDWKRCVASRLPLLLLSILTGTLTHFIWDGFTHDQEYYLARHLTLLMHPVHVIGYTVPLHLLLQGISSVTGLGLLYLYIRHLPAGRAQKKSEQAIRSFWLTVFGISAVTGVIRWMTGMPDEKIIGQIIVVSISSFHLGLLVVCAVLQLRRQRAPAT